MVISDAYVHLKLHALSSFGRKFVEFRKQSFFLKLYLHYIWKVYFSFVCTVFPNAFIKILHLSSVYLLICCRYKCIIDKANLQHRYYIA